MYVSMAAFTQFNIIDNRIKIYAVFMMKFKSKHEHAFRITYSLGEGVEGWGGVGAGRYEGNPSMTGGFPSQMTSNAEHCWWICSDSLRLRWRHFYDTTLDPVMIYLDE